MPLLVGSIEMTSADIRCMILVALVAGASFPPTKSQSVKCIKEDSNFDKCLEDVSNKFMNEIDADTFVVPSTEEGVTFTVNNGPLTATATYSNWTFVDLNKNVIELELNSDTRTISGFQKIPHCRVIVDFEIKGKFGNFPLVGSGSAEVDIWDTQASFINELKIQNVESSKTIEMDNKFYNLDTIGKVKINPTKVVSPNKNLAEGLKLVLKQFGRTLVLLVKPEIEKNFNQGFTIITGRVFDKILKDGVYKIA